MTSRIEVASPATSTKGPVTVTERRTLWSGCVVKVPIPTNAITGTYKDSEKTIPYIRFFRTIAGGAVNCFVHTDDQSCLGKTVTAEISVMCKKLSDGREYLYVDFRPVEAGTRITHRLVITATIAEEPPRDWIVFWALAPLQGVIVLAQPGSKMPSGGTATTAPYPAKATTSAKTSTGDAVLDRLLSEGWQVETDNGGPVVQLFKMKGETRRTMTHHRPRKEVKDKKK